MLAAILSLGCIGMVAAVALGIAAKKFAVEVDPRELAAMEVLPGANCGACGFPGCAGYAKALVAGTADINQCPPGGAEVVAKLARILGVEASASASEFAVVLCQGDNSKAQLKYHYLGLEDCTAAQRIADGPKVCPGGCLGLGSCQRACPFDAIEMTATGLAVINREKCTGCRKCVAVCPRQVIRMAPSEATVHVLCNSHDKGAVVRKYCQVGCIACHLCQKAAPDAYKIENFLATVVYEHHNEAAVAITKCPTKCIRDFSEGYPDGSALLPAVADKPHAA
ncbi:MAG: RnfABCDGE type electron transport complex subunit B [Desulfuromonadales bacterium]|nr:RnfABCDGE type electron transport complex subunit B [Desulfuromonadales bacterium]